jgi:hypothetical protein
MDSISWPLCFQAETKPVDNYTRAKPNKLLGGFASASGAEDHHFKSRQGVKFLRHFTYVHGNSCNLSLDHKNYMNVKKVSKNPRPYPRSTGWWMRQDVWKRVGWRGGKRKKYFLNLTNQGLVSERHGVGRVVLEGGAAGRGKFRNLDPAFVAPTVNHFGLSATDLGPMLW